MIDSCHIRKHLVLSCIAVLLVLSTIIIDRSDSLNVHIDTCYIQREIEKPPQTKFQIPLRDGALHNYSVLIIWMAMILLVLLPRKRLQAAFSLTYGSLWFHNTYILLAAMKATLEDVQCAGRHVTYPNGISGHYCYFFFVILTAHRFTQTRLKTNHSASRFVLLLLTFFITLFSIGAFGTLYRTFFHGYHSARQVFLGTALGIISHVLLDLTLFSDDQLWQILPLEAELSADISRTGIMAANSLLCLGLYFKLWPHLVAGPSITNGHLLFHASLWGILIALLFVRSHFQQKVAVE